MQIRRSAQESPEHETPMPCGRFLICLTTVLVIMLPGKSVPGQVQIEGAVQLDNGLILSGLCSTENTFDPSVPSRNLEIRLIDQGFRQYYVSTRLSQPPVPDPTAVPAMLFTVPQRSTGRRAMPAAIGVSIMTPFDQNGQASVTLQLSDGSTEEITVGIRSFNAKFAEVAGLTHNWQFGIATSSIPDGSLYPGFLSKVKGFADGGTRLNMVAALVEASQIAAAQRLLESIHTDFPDLKPQTDQLGERVRRNVSDRILDELQLRQQVGQSAFAANLARRYNQDDLIPEARVSVRQLIDDHQQQRRRVAALRMALSDQVATLDDEELRFQAQQLLAGIDRELDIPLLPRFSSFELLAGTEGVSAESQLALAVSGWLLGADDAVQVFPEAYGLFQLRELVLDYCHTADGESDRRNELIGQMRKLEGFSVNRVARLIQNLPALDAVAIQRDDDLLPGRFGLAATETSAGCVGQVPREYSENREYPLLIALPREGVPATQSLTWWQTQADRNGFVVVVPELYPANVAEYDGSADSHRRLLQLIRRVKRGLRVDDDRVFIAGHGIGAEAATDIATAHPDLFAGVASIAGLGRLHLNWVVQNAPDLGWYIVLGDSQPYRSARMGKLLKKLFQRFDDVGKFANVLLVSYPGRGFESFYEETPRLFEWMQTQRRQLYPEKLDDITLLRSTDRSWYWLELDSIPSEKVSLDEPNTFEDKPANKARIEAYLTSGNVVRLRVLPGPAFVKLSPDMPGIDIQQPIVVGSGRRSPRVDYKPSLRDLLDEFRSTGDRKRLCFMKIPVGR